MIPSRETQEISLCNNDGVTDENITENTEKNQVVPGKQFFPDQGFKALNNQCQELRSRQISINILHQPAGLFLQNILRGCLPHVFVGELL